MQRRPLVAGNWKMNGTRAANTALIAALGKAVGDYPGIDMLVCPPAVYLESVARELSESAILLGAQNLCEQTLPGAYTGEIQGAMLAELGCRYVIVGHSERRAFYAEDDAKVAAKFAAALAAGLTPILCVGETLAEREQGATDAVLGRQLRAVIDSCGIAAFKSAVLAYEPVWAIGTGRTATADQVEAAHAFLRGEIAMRDAIIAGSLRILYGGSVKADNAAQLFAGSHVDGGLIGGASLKAGEFLAICAAASQAR